MATIRTEYCLSVWRQPFQSFSVTILEKYGSVAALSPVAAIANTALMSLFA